MGKPVMADREGDRVTTVARVRRYRVLGEHRCDLPECGIVFPVTTQRPQKRYCCKSHAGRHAGQIDPGRFTRLAASAHAARRRKGRKALTRPSERLLLASGRFEEAARLIYDRAYGAGWLAGRTSRRQLPWSGEASRMALSRFGRTQLTSPEQV